MSRCHRHELYRRVSQYHPELEDELEKLVEDTSVGRQVDDPFLEKLDKTVFNWAAKHDIDVTLH